MIVKNDFSEYFNYEETEIMEATFNLEAKDIQWIFDELRKHYDDRDLKITLQGSYFEIIDVVHGFQIPIADNKVRLKLKRVYS